MYKRQNVFVLTLDRMVLFIRQFVVLRQDVYKRQAFEYSSVDADISGSINSVFNPKSGRITAEMCIRDRE